MAVTQTHLLFIVFGLLFIAFGIFMLVKPGVIYWLQTAGRRFWGGKVGERGNLWNWWNRAAALFVIVTGVYLLLIGPTAATREVERRAINATSTAVQAQATQPAATTSP
jgi:hypothetical protein